MKKVNMKPVVLTPDEICDTLDGRASQFRRLVVPVPEWEPYGGIQEIHKVDNAGDFVMSSAGHPIVTSYGISNYEGDKVIKSPYGTEGFLLWVRESFRVDVSDDLQSAVISYRHGESMDVIGESLVKSLYKFNGKWNPWMHMPLIASRLSLAVEKIKYQRLSEMTDEDAKECGVNGGCLNCGGDHPCECDNPKPDYLDAYIGRWNKKNLPQYKWRGGLLVWVVDFEANLFRKCEDVPAV